MTAKKDFIIFKNTKNDRLQLMYCGDPENEIKAFEELKKLLLSEDEFSK